MDEHYFRIEILAVQVQCKDITILLHFLYILFNLGEFSFAQHNTGNKIKESTRLIVSSTAVSCHLQYSLHFVCSIKKTFS